MTPDFNLLVVFDAVFETGSVTAAAERLSLSQPAVSHALNRLRAVMGDSLFVRGRKGLVATARAQAVAGDIHRLVADARRVFLPSGFDAATRAQRFVIGSSDYATLTLAPLLIAAVHKAAPGITLNFEPVGKQTLAELETGPLDVSFWGTKPPHSPWHWLSLFQEDHACVVSSDHPFAAFPKNRALTLTDYLSHPHITVSFHTPGDNRIDAALAALEAKRRIVAKTHSFASVLQAVAGTDMIATMPRRLISAFNTPRYLVFDLPFPVPSYDYGLVWHARCDADPASRWLREKIVETCARGLAK